MVDLLRCGVCRETAEEKALAICDYCGERFHLNPRNDVPGKDCGVVWINEDHLGLEFACQACLERSEGHEAPALRRTQAPSGRAQSVRRRYRKRS